MSGINWGSVPDWIVAAATAAGFFFGLRLLRRQIRGHEQAEQDRLSVHAEKIAAWSEGDLRFGKLTMYVRNGGSMPIYQCHAEVPLPADTTLVSGIEMSLRVVEPGETKSEKFTFASPPSDVDSPAVQLRFVDVSGQRWRRETDGTLRFISDDEELWWSWKEIN